MTILKLLWPHMQRLLAQRAADYLQQRRERRLTQQANPEPIASGLVEELPIQPETQVEIVECLPAPTRLSRKNAVWFTMAGVLLGNAIGLILAQIFRRED
ncbi:MAG: hypothetical protein U0401_28800 [Anaerolineae bacterium]